MQVNQSNPASPTETPRRPETPFSVGSPIASNQTSFSSGSRFDVRQPEAYLKQLAINDAPYQARGSIETLIDRLESNPNLDFQMLTRLASGFIHENASTPGAVETLFKYLNCRSLIDHQNKGDTQETLLQTKATFRKSMPNLLKAHPENSASTENLLSGRTKLGPVITSHPTQLNRPESMASLNSYKSDGFESPNAAEEFAQELWNVGGRRTEKPSVLDEAKAAEPAVMNILRAIRSSTKPIMESHTATTAGNAARNSFKEPVLQAGNWIAGDRDGNPTITPELLGDVMAMWSQLAFNEFANKLAPKDPIERPHSLHNLFHKAGKAEALNDLNERLHHTMLHVVNRDNSSDGSMRFGSPSDLANHVETLKSKLDWSKLNPIDRAAVTQKLNQLAMWVKTFGFHGVSTHIRQNSEVNEKTVEALVSGMTNGAQYSKLSEKQKVELLSKVLSDDPRHALPTQATSTDSNVQKELGFLDSYKALRERFGDEALPTIITANTETLSDMLEVCVMLKYAGLGKDGDLGMNVMPLIETVPDMQNAEALMEGLLKNPSYQQHLKHRGNVQHVMLGYSDSMRGDGIVAAAWEGHKLPATLLKVANAHNEANENTIKIHFFHGRGGTEARGARDNYTDEIGHVDGRSLELGYTQTEQGEEAFKKFGQKETAKANMNKLLGAAISTSGQNDRGQMAKYGETMEAMSDHSRTAYLELYQHPQLADFLQKTTPLPYVGATNAGSRPASRIANLTGQEFLGKLRAIPYVAAFYQTGSMAPAYFGLGSGIQQLLEQAPGGQAAKAKELQTMYKEWPFFKNLIDRAESAMNKADMEVAGQYAAINKEAAPVFELLRNEFNLTRAMIDKVTGKNSEMTASQIPSLRKFAHAAQIALLKLEQPGSKNIEPNQKDALVAASMQVLASSIGRFG